MVETSTVYRCEGVFERTKGFAMPVEDVKLKRRDDGPEWLLEGKRTPNTSPRQW
jgi:hypothetical protein